MVCSICDARKERSRYQIMMQRPHSTYLSYSSVHVSACQRSHSRDTERQESALKLCILFTLHELATNLVATRPQTQYIVHPSRLSPEVSPSPYPNAQDLLCMQSSNSTESRLYSFMPSTWCTRNACRMLRSNMISSLPPGMAYARTSRYSLSTFAPWPPRL